MSAAGTLADGAVPPLDAATAEAVDWLVTLHSGETSAAEHQGFAAWLAAHPTHSDAWQALTGSLEHHLSPARTAPALARRPAGALLGNLLARADARMRERRRWLRGGLAVGGLATGAAALLAERHVPLGQLSADLRTATGERRVFRLADGSTVSLDARSAADVDLRPGRRTITLRQGALVAQAAPVQRLADARAREVGLDAAFAVRTEHGELRALGTRLVVRHGADQSYVGMLEHSVQITTPDGPGAVLHEGESAWFGARGIQRSVQDPVSAGAWQRGMLEVQDQPLGEVLQALRAYRTGFIRVAPRAAALRVYGTYALDDTDRALAVLAETLPIEVRVYQRGWLVVIE